MCEQITEFQTAAREMIAAFGNCGSPRQQAAADALQTCVDMADKYAAGPQLAARARGLYANDDCEVDDDATTSPADTGTWVSAWVWVPLKQGGDNE